ncbi:unnamed protein product [Bathycoccus prasinos]
MQANEDNALEGLALLEQQNPYQGAPIHREEQFLDSNLANSEKFDESSLWNPFATQRDAYAALELECFVKKEANGIIQLVRSGNQCRVICRDDVGRIKWNKVLKKYKPIGRNRHICSYHAHIRKIRLKDDHHHWIIDPKHTWLLSIQVNNKVKVTGVHAKRAWKEGNGVNPRDFRESFTRLDHLINYLDSAGKCAARISWSAARDEMLMLPEDQRGNGDIKYFSRYALCARGLRDFLAKAGVPYFSFDACNP